ncbi:MAG: hypothetical protein ACKPDM_16995, partial [Dolichospermum sp.]
QSYQTALEVQLEKILEADTELAKEIAEILKTQKSDSGATVVNAQSYGESIQINKAGGVDNATYDLRRISEKK